MERFEMCEENKMAARTRSRRTSRTKTSPTVDRSLSPPVASKKKHSKYCDCEECCLLYDQQDGSVCSLTSLFQPRTLLSIASVIIFLFLTKCMSFLFPFGLFRSTAYGFELNTLSSRVQFTFQQHIWSTLPLVFGDRSRLAIQTLHLFLNTLILSALLTKSYMSDMAAVITMIAAFTLMGQCKDSPSWKSFFKAPCQFTNVCLTFACIKCAMESRLPAG